MSWPGRLHQLFVVVLPEPSFEMLNFWMKIQKKRYKIDTTIRSMKKSNDKLDRDIAGEIQSHPVAEAYLSHPRILANKSSRMWRVHLSLTY
jgi:hypothetical protein